ncbi:GGDEF domain-containing protein [Mycoplasmatota bacterium WC30]
MYNEKVRKKVSEEYKIDLVNDIIFADDYHVTFCFDWTKKEKAEIMILTGNVGAFGLEQKQKYLIEDLMGLIEIENPISEIFGVNNYLDDLMKDIDGLIEFSEIYLPLKSDKGILWVICSMKRLTQKNGVNELIFGRVNWISNKVPNAIKFYQSRYKDPVTNLFSKETLKLHLGKARNTDHSYGLFLDIDNFKRINDIFGHNMGDKYLTELGEKFRSDLECDVKYYRIGGDEFFVYLVNCTEEQAFKKAERVIYDVETLNEEGQQADVSASVGIVPIIGNDFDLIKLLDLADRAMYHSKGKGKGYISYARDV